MKENLIGKKLKITKSQSPFEAPALGAKEKEKEMEMEKEKEKEKEQEEEKELGNSKSSQGVILPLNSEAFSYVWKSLDGLQGSAV